MKFTTIRYRAFTLVEMLIVVAILAFLFTIVASFLGAVSRAWNTGEQQVATFQDGRAILDVIGRELSQAVISPSLQFIAYSNLSGTRTNSDSIFWQAPLTYRVTGSATPLTNLCEVGYYLAQDNTQTGANVYQLRRFFVQPGDTTNYQIFAAAPSDSSGTWVASYLTKAAVYNRIATGVIALWIRCLDSNGDLIPWASSSIHFNSAAHFQAAIAGPSPTPSPSPSFKYTAPSTAQAHLLPNAVELTLVIVDDKALLRGLTIPGMPSLTAPADVPAAVASFNSALITNHISSARTFTTQIPIPNSFRQ